MIKILILIIPVLMITGIRIFTPYRRNVFLQSYHQSWLLRHRYESYDHTTRLRLKYSVRQL